MSDPADRTRRRPEHAPASQRAVILAFALIEFVLIATSVLWILTRR